MTFKFGEQLRREGYRGYFELDFLIDKKTGDLWLGELKVKGDAFSGVIDNTPVYVKQKSGDRLSFKRSDVVDWMYVDAQGRLVGNFTACALMSKEPPAKAKAFAEQYGLNCTGF